MADELAPPTADPAAPRRARARRPVRATPEARERRRRRVRWALLIISGVLMVNALFGEKGYLAMVQARQEHARISGRLEAIKSENARLTEEARRLREDPGMLESAAREDLGMVRPGETLVTIRDRARSERQ